MPSSKNPPKGAKSRRRPGAPPGNLNALKHGFYSKIFRNTELEELHQFDAQDVAQEIELLRIIIRRTAERAAEAESFDSQLRFLSVLGQSTAQLTRLLNVQESYLRAQRSEADGEYMVELYNEMCADTRRRFASLHTKGKPAQAPPAAPPVKNEVPQGDCSQGSLFSDEDSQSQEAADDKFWPTYIDPS
jgi:hypothetical protein